MNGIPIFAISIAVAKRNELIAGVIFNPVIPSLFYAEKGKGAFWNKYKISVSSQDASTAMVTLGRSQKDEDKERVIQLFQNLPKKIKTVRYLASAGLELAYVARGGTEGFINLGTKKWDYAAGALILLEAGGKITDVEGNPWNLDQNYFIASNGVIHSELVSAIKETN